MHSSVCSKSFEMDRGRDGYWLLGENRREIVPGRYCGDSGSTVAWVATDMELCVCLCLSLYDILKKMAGSACVQQSSPPYDFFSDWTYSRSLTFCRKFLKSTNTVSSADALLLFPFSQSFSGHVGGNGTSGALASAAGPAPPPVLTQARRALAAAAAGAETSLRGGNVSASVVQTIPRGGGGGLGIVNGTVRLQGGGVGAGGPAVVGGGGYGSAVVDVMGEGMETLTLPKLVLQGDGLEEVGAREEAYGVLARLGEL